MEFSAEKQNSTQFVCARLLFFAKAKDIVGVDETNFLVPSIISNGVELKNLILLKFPDLRQIVDNFVLAVDQNYVNDDDDDVNLRMSDGIEIAIIPPLSGG